MQGRPSVMQSCMFVPIFPNPFCLKKNMKRFFNFAYLYILSISPEHLLCQQIEVLYQASLKPLPLVHISTKW